MFRKVKQNLFSKSVGNVKHSSKFCMYTPLSPAGKSGNQETVGFRSTHLLHRPVNHPLSVITVLEEQQAQQKSKGAEEG